MGARRRAISAGTVPAMTARTAAGPPRKIRASVTGTSVSECEYEELRNSKCSGQRSVTAMASASAHHGTRPPEKGPPPQTVVVKRTPAAATMTALSHQTGCRRSRIANRPDDRSDDSGSSVTSGASASGATILSPLDGRGSDSGQQGAREVVGVERAQVLELLP